MRNAKSGTDGVTIPAASAPDEAEGSKTLFVISPIGDGGSDTRKHSNYFYDYLVCEVAEPLGYKCERADKIDSSGIITNQIIERVTSADIVVADLSGHNPNVFYELALRHAVQKPFIHCIREGEIIPFDISQNWTIFFNLFDPKSLREAQDGLRGAIEVILAGKKPESPFSIHAQVTQLASSDSGTDHKLAVLIQQVSDLSLQVASIQNYVPRQLTSPQFLTRVEC